MRELRYEPVLDEIKIDEELERLHTRGVIPSKVWVNHEPEDEQNLAGEVDDLKKLSDFFENVQEENDKVLSRHTGNREQRRAASKKSRKAKRKAR